jgi:hypothetical protein
MRLSYDSEGDVLNVIFDERLRRAPKIAYELREGLILYLAADSMKPIQLTAVNYRRLSEFPTFLFSGWKKLKSADRKKLLPILASPALSSFLKLDPQTGYGYVSKSVMLDMFHLAA